MTERKIANQQMSGSANAGDKPAIKVFVVCSYSSKVNYDTGEVFPEFRDFLKREIGKIEAAGGEVFNALRFDNYKINSDDPAAAFRVDLEEIQKADAIIAFLENRTSAGVQTEIGIALALGKPIFIASSDGFKHQYFNDAIIRAGFAQEISLPLQENELRQIFSDKNSFRQNQLNAE